MVSAKKMIIICNRAVSVYKIKLRNNLILHQIFSHQLRQIIRLSGTLGSLCIFFIFFLEGGGATMGKILTTLLPVIKESGEVDIHL